MKLFTSNLEAEDPGALDAEALEPAVNDEGLARLVVFIALLRLAEAIEEDFPPRVAFIDFPDDVDTLDAFCEDALEPAAIEEDFARLVVFIDKSFTLIRDKTQSYYNCLFQFSTMSLVIICIIYKWKNIF